MNTIEHIEQSRKESIEQMVEESIFYAQVNANIYSSIVELVNSLKEYSSEEISLDYQFNKEKLCFYIAKTLVNFTDNTENSKLCITIDNFGIDENLIEISFITENDEHMIFEKIFSYTDDMIEIQSFISQVAKNYVLCCY